MNITKYIAPASIFALPLAVFAQTFEGTMERVSTFLNQIIPFLILVATILFLWGVVKYITAAGDEDKVTEGRNLIIYGIIGLAVMIGVWGFVNIVLTFIFTTSDPIPIPGPTGVPQQL
jgi:fumarate reductase subunit D